MRCLLASESEDSAMAYYVDVLNDIVERAVMGMDEGMDVDDAVSDAIDSGMIYTDDQMAVADHFGTLDVGRAFEDAYEDFYNEVYQEVEAQAPDDDDDDDAEDEE